MTGYDEYCSFAECCLHIAAVTDDQALEQIEKAYANSSWAAAASTMMSASPSSNNEPKVIAL